MLRNPSAKCMLGPNLITYVSATQLECVRGVWAMGSSSGAHSYMGLVSSGKHAHVQGNKYSVKSIWML